ncbi:MAG: adenylate/guanylate cyclase domain-containing protein [Pseudomonadota bacterium]
MLDQASLTGIARAIVYMSLMSKPLDESGLDLAFIDVVADWLMDEALADTTMSELVKGCCQRLHAAGVPLSRAMVSYRTLHPLFGAIWLMWHRGEGMGTYEMPHGRVGDEVFRKSPFFHMLDSGVPYLRRKLEGNDTLLDFPVLQDLTEQGATDYLAGNVPFGPSTAMESSGDGIFVSWTTDRPGGFSETDIRSLRRIQKRLAVACKVRIRTEVTQNIVTTYLGPDPGSRVLDGRIKRGDGESIHAVIWYSDLRNSTRLAELLSPADYLAALNSYFECTAGAVLDHGGQVLLLIGDAVLAIFPTAEAGEKAAAAKALAAAKEAGERMEEINVQRHDAGESRLTCGLALHIGDLTYGNIGVPQRLQFTVVGPAANQVARIEALTKTLDRPLLASAEFAGVLDVAWEDLGSHVLKGIPQPVDVFAPPSA